MKQSSQQSFTILLLGASALVLVGWAAHMMQQKALAREVMTGQIGVEVARIAPASGVSPGFAGDFLASYHAQSQYDWKSANEFLERVLAQDPENPELLRRSMVLAMGAGDLKVASERARQLSKLTPNDPANALGIMILTVDDIQAGKLDAALNQIDKMPAGDLTEFIRPIISSWILAGQGKFDVTNFNPTTVHLYHASLMAIRWVGHQDINRAERDCCLRGRDTREVACRKLQRVHVIEVAQRIASHHHVHLCSTN